jgi:hypothetical protein
LQTLIDPFIRGAGGELVGDTLGEAPNLPKNADYLFRRFGVIAELKSLEEGSFGESFQNKMSELAVSWANRGLLLLYGTQRLDLASLPAPCQQDVLSVISKPLQNNILRKANRQTRSTKEALGLPYAKGLLMIASDGNEDLKPQDVLFFCSRIFWSDRQDKKALFPDINGVVYFNPRMPAVHPATGQATLIWGTVLRSPQDPALIAFLDELSEAFRVYMEATWHVPFLRAELRAGEHQKLRFAGVAERRIKVPRKILLESVFPKARERLGDDNGCTTRLTVSQNKSSFASDNLDVIH